MVETSRATEFVFFNHERTGENTSKPQWEQIPKGSKYSLVKPSKLNIDVMWNNNHLKAVVMTMERVDSCPNAWIRPSGKFTNQSNAKLVKKRYKIMNDRIQLDLSCRKAG